MHVILYLSWPWANCTSIVKPSLVLWRFPCPSRPSFPFSLQCCIPKASSESDRPREVETALNHLLRKLVRLPTPDELLLSNDCEPGSASRYDVNTPSPAMNHSNRLTWTYYPSAALRLCPNRCRYSSRSNSSADPRAIR